MDNPKIQIVTKEINGSPIYTEISIDGHILKGVRSWELKQGVGNSIPTLTIDLNALNLQTDVAVILKQAGIGNIESIKFTEYGEIKFPA